MRKTFLRIVRYGLCLLATGLVSVSLAGPVFTISPSAITNDYAGTINLNITGLTAGKTVRVERFLDVNSNGIVDPGEMLVESFTVTDGQLPLIGGVRNSNVPGDDDSSTNGQIMVKLPYPDPGATVDGIAGSYLVRVSDPTSSFAPVIQTFTVSQKVLPQGVTGIMTAAGSGLPLSNVVAVLAPQNGNGVVGTVTDTNGAYTIYSKPNNYAVICVKPGYVSDQRAGSVAISSNSFATVNLTNAAGNTIIAGNVSDSSTGVGLPGMFVQVQNTNNLFAGFFTDTNGSFTFTVPAGKWKLKLSGQSGPLLGYVSQNNSLNADTTGGNASNANFQMPKATALVYGNIKDAQSNAVAFMRMDAQDQGNLFQAAGRSDANGHYSIGVLGSTALNVGPDNDALAAANLIGIWTNVVITNGQTMALNFVVQHVTAHLRGRVIDNNSNAVSDLQLVFFPVSTNGNAGPNLNPSTDSNGNFDVGLYGGSWNMNLEINSAASHNLVGPIQVFNVTDGVDINNITIVAQIATAHISGTVLDNHGAPLVGVRPFGNATVNGTNYLVGATTDTNGFYSFAVFPANWTVGINSGDLPARGFQNPPNQSVIITGSNNQTANFVGQPLSSSAPTLGQVMFSGGQFQFQINALSGRNYRIDASTNLTSWVPVSTNTAFGGNFTFSDPNTASYKRRFYRAVLLP